VKKHESQVGNRDKLKTLVLNYGISKKVHMTQLARFAAEDLVIVVWARWSSFNELRLLDLVGKVRRQSYKHNHIWWYNPYEAIWFSRIGNGSWFGFHI